jgi:hypothetical protein
MRSFLPFFLVVVSVTLAWSADTGTCTLSSAYTKLDSCGDAPGYEDAEEHGADTPMLCRGMAGYSLFETYSGCCSFRSIVNDRDSTVADLVPPGNCDMPEYGAAVEWRTCDDEPFAVIHRVTCYAPDPESGNYSPDKSVRQGEYLMVRGLEGHDLNVNIDVKEHKNANQAARDAADSYMRGEVEKE